jgi:hypothetical protein
MSPTLLPEGAKKPRQHSIVSLVIIATIAFSLTVVAASIALMAGVLPAAGLNAAERFDMGALMLFVPICLLTFGIIAEATRIAATSPTSIPQTVDRIDWRRSQRED